MFWEEKIEKFKDIFNKVNKSELGWFEISSFNKNSNNEKSLLLKEPLKVVHWHRDRKILPPKAELLANKQRCKEQLFIIGDSIYGLQFNVQIEGLMNDN